MSATNSSGATVAVLEEDVFFLGRIGPALASRNMTMQVVRPGEPVPPGVAGILLDLSYSGDWESLVSAAKGEGVETVAFGPHVDGETIRRARKSGCARVMAKSKFVVELGSILDRWAEAAVAT